MKITSPTRPRLLPLVTLALLAVLPAAGCVPGLAWLPDSSGFVFTEGEKVETDTVQALLERRNANGKSAWMVLEIWNLEQGGTEDQFKQFVGRVSKRRKTEGIPGKIFPEQL